MSLADPLQSPGKAFVQSPGKVHLSTIRKVDVCPKFDTADYEWWGTVTPKCSLEQDTVIFPRVQSNAPPDGLYEVRYCGGAFFEFAGWTVSRIPKSHGPIFNPFSPLQSDIYTWIFYNGGANITWMPEERPEGWGAATQAGAEAFAKGMKVRFRNTGGFGIWVYFNSQEPGDPPDSVDGNPNPTYALYRIKTNPPPP